VRATLSECFSVFPSPLERASEQGSVPQLPWIPDESSAGSSLLLSYAVVRVDTGDGVGELVSSARVSTTAKLPNELRKTPSRWNLKDTQAQARRHRGGQCPPLYLKSVPPFHVWLLGCCIHPIMYYVFKNVSPLVVSPPCCKILARGCTNCTWTTS